MHIDNITSEKMTLDTDGKSMQISIYEKNIEQLQQENKQLNQLLKDKGFIIDKLMEENRQLKGELEKIKQPTIFIDTQDMEERYSEGLYQDYLEEENQSLKKQLEAINEQANYLRKSVERKEETIIDLQNERVPYTNEYIAKLETQQKEFIEYLENMIKAYKEPKLTLNCHYTDLEVMQLKVDFLEEILSKYKEIIGVSK